MSDLDILYEDNHLLVINKTAGIATMGAEAGPTLHSLAAAYLKRAYNKPGKAFVGVVSRLDSVTSGVIVLARTSKAASRLSNQFARRDSDGPKKIYLAAVEGRLNSEQGILTDHVLKDDRAKRMRVVGADVEGARPASLRYVRLGMDDASDLIAVELLSGRKHQIRVQLADRGHPVIGDRKYGSSRRFRCGIALHSWRLRIEHPTKREPMWFEASTPREWKSLRHLLPPDADMHPAVLQRLESVAGERDE